MIDKDKVLEAMTRAMQESTYKKIGEPDIYGTQLCYLYPIEDCRIMTKAALKAMAKALPEPTSKIVCIGTYVDNADELYYQIKLWGKDEQ